MNGRVWGMKYSWLHSWTVQGLVWNSLLDELINSDSE